MRTPLIALILAIAPLSVQAQTAMMKKSRPFPALSIIRKVLWPAMNLTRAKGGSVCRSVAARTRFCTCWNRAA